MRRHRSHAEVLSDPGVLPDQHMCLLAVADARQPVRMHWLDMESQSDHTDDPGSSYRIRVKAVL